jgi:Gamma interferon inducible lysosomal thiol reductase (GILT)
MRVNFGTIAVAIATISISSPATAKRPIVAVFNIDGAGSGLRRSLLERYSAYLTAQVAATGAYLVTPRAKLGAALRRQKIRSYRQCHDESCQIEIGRELAAQLVLSSKVLKFGRRCVISCVLTDLRTQVHTFSVTVKGRCTKEGLMESIDKAVVKLASGGNRPPPVELEVYGMSKCPYAAKLMRTLERVVQRLGSRVKLKIDYILERRKGKLWSMHGPAELKGARIQLCAQAIQPGTLDHLAFVNCMNRTLEAIPGGWRACARKPGYAIGRIQRCAHGRQGTRLLVASMQRSRAAGARGSPTLRIAGKEYRGGRGEAMVMRAICKASPNPKPNACGAVKSLRPVTATVITDRRCTRKACNTSGLVNNLRTRFFPQLKLRYHDYSSRKGRRLYHRLKLTQLPAVLFHPGVALAENYSSLKRWLKRRGQYLLLKVPFGTDPTAEICDNRKDDTGNGHVDCADPTCRGDLRCRPDRKGDLQLFMMSRCRFAAKAVRSVRQLLPRFGRQLKLTIHYIATRDPRSPLGFRSLHGEREVREDLRQICAIHHYGKGYRYLDYMACRVADVRDENWRRCAKGGISAAVIKRCAEGPEGRRLLANDIQHAKTLRITGSPTWLGNNRHLFTAALSKEKLKKEICRLNSLLLGCGL